MSEFASTDPRTDLLGNNDPAHSSNDEPHHASSVWLVVGDDPSVVWKGFAEVLDRTEIPVGDRFSKRSSSISVPRRLVTWQV